MSLSPQDMEILRKAKQEGKTKEQALAAFALSRQSQSPGETQQPGIFSRVMRDIPSDIIETGRNIGTTLKTGFDKTMEARGQVASGEISRGAGAVKAGGATAKALLTAPFEAVLGLAKLPFTPEAEAKIAESFGVMAKEGIESGKQHFRNTLEEFRVKSPDGKKAVEQIEGLFEKYKTDPSFKAYVDGVGDFTIAGAEAAGFKGASKIGNVRRLAPELDTPYFQATEQAVAEAIDTTKKVTESARGASAGFKTPTTDLLSPTLGEKAVDAALLGAQKTVQTYRDLVDSAQTRIVRNLDNQAIRENAKLPIKDVEQNIQTMYVNAVSPGVKGKKVTTEGITANKEQAVQAIKGLTLNKNDISFRDIETNQIVKGELPSNLWEFGGAVTDRKSKVYQEVLEQIGKAADEPVDTTRIMAAMSDIIENPVYAGETAIVNRARQALEKYSMTDYTPMQLEDLIKLENDKLQAFYRGSGSQADAIVSAIVANNLRDMLDEAVEAATGSRVRPLKQEYGNLKAIERDVVHRALHNAQARNAGLVDMFGIRTIGDVSAGLAGDMGALRRGAGQIVGEGFIKAINDRDAMINRMFMVAYQAYTTQ